MEKEQQSEKHLSNETIDGSWEDALQTIFKSELETAIVNQQPFNIDYWKLDKHNQELANKLLDEPLVTIKQLMKTIKKETNNGGINVNLTFKGFPVTQINLSDLRTNHLNKLNSIEGFIIQSSSSHPRIVVGAFRCKKCGKVIFIQQKKDTEKLIEPIECYEDQGGCGRATSWEMLPEKSLYKDFQKILIQNPFYQQQRVELETHLYDSHCGIVVPGEWVTFNGIYLLKSELSQTPKPYYLVRGIEQSHARSLEFTEDEKKTAEDLSKSKELWSKLIKNFSPSIFGYFSLKEALLLQLFGGVWYDLDDGTTRRGSIHILAVGDPATAKSVLKQGSSTISPRFTSASGRNASVAGLTAGATKDKLAEREGWTLQAGAIVIANGGLCYLDEFDKIPPETQGCLHAPMEQGIIEVSKMGAVNQKLPARTAILASMNPKDGRFNNDQPFINQVDLDPALLSRFDLIFAVTDKPDKKLDYKISKHMHKVITGKEEQYELPPELLRKYIYYAKQINPVMSNNIDDLLTNKFVDYRSESKINDQGYELHNITFRHKDSLRRLAEASARSRFSKKIERIDVERAWRVFESSLESLGIKDLDTIATGWNDHLRSIKRNIEPLLPTYYQDLRRSGFEEIDIDALVSRGFLREVDGKFFKKERKQ